MQTVTRSELIDLARRRGDGPYVSVFLPTHRAGPETRQDPIRLKNLLTAAERELDEAQRDVLQPAWRLVEDREFWQHQSDGLAVLASREGTRVLRVPVRLQEASEVGERFRVAPLVPLLARDARFHLLAFSRGRVRLFECTAEGIGELEGDALPSSLEDAVGRDWEERSIQHRTATPSGDARRNDAMFHGQGAADEDEHREMIRFVELVDRGVRELLPADGTPLVLATVDELAGEFRKRSHHPSVLDEWVRGNPDEKDPAELRDAAWPLVEEVLAEPRRRAAARFRERHGTGLATDQPDRVVLAAMDGRVESLFAARGAECRGRVEPDMRTVAVAEDGDEELLDRAAVETLVHDGQVFVVPAEEMPAEGVVLAAVLRY